MYICIYVYIYICIYIYISALVYPAILLSDRAWNICDRCCFRNPGFCICDPCCFSYHYPAFLQSIQNVMQPCFRPRHLSTSDSACPPRPPSRPPFIYIICRPPPRPPSVYILCHPPPRRPFIYIVCHPPLLLRFIYQIPLAHAPASAPTIYLSRMPPSA